MIDPDCGGGPDEREEHEEREGFEEPDVRIELVEADRAGLNRESLLEATPEVMRIAGERSALSESARLMRALNLAPLERKLEAAEAASLTATAALAGSDELAGECGRLLHSVIARPLEIPERRTPAFAAFDAIAARAAREAQEASEPDADGGEDPETAAAELPLAGLTVAVSGNIDVEGLSSKASGELIEEPGVRMARPVDSLLAAGASLTAVAPAGELLGLLSPDAPARSMTTGEPVNAAALESDEADPRDATPFTALASLVAFGAAGAGLGLGRASDMARAAIASGLAFYRPTLGVMMSQDGFASSWRFCGWGAFSRWLTDATRVMICAAAREGVSDEPGHAPWEFPGFRPSLMSTSEVLAWCASFALERKSVTRVALAVASDWSDKEERDVARRVVERLEARGIEVVRAEGLAERAPIVDWVTWTELAPVLDEFLSRRYPLHTGFRTEQLAMMMTLSERVRKGPWARRRFVSLLRRAPELLSPRGPQIVREALLPLAEPMERLFAGDKPCDAVVWLGTPPSVDVAKGPVIAVPLARRSAASGGGIIGATVLAEPGEDMLAGCVANVLRQIQGELDPGEDFCVTARPGGVVAPWTEEDERRAEEARKANESHENHEAAAKAASKAHGCSRSDLLENNFAELAQIALSSRSDDSTHLRVIDAGTEGAPEEASGSAVDAKALGERVEALFREFRDALSDAAEDEPEAKAEASGESMEADDEADEADEADPQTGGADARDGTQPSQEAEGAEGAKGAEDAGQAAPEEDPIAKVLPDVTDEERAWLAEWFPGREKAAALLARVDFVRELLPAGLPDRWEAGDDAFLVQFAKYWLYRRDRRKVERLLGRIPEERRTYEVREHLVLSLLLDHDPARAREMIATLKPETDEEKSSREWLLGLAAQRRGDADAAIEHFRKSRDLSPESTSANFPLAQSLLAKYGPENEEYKAARNFLKTRAPTGWQLLLTEEARRRKAQNFERELLPELSSGVFSATILLPQGSLELRKERLADELWRSWSLGLADKTPDDRDAFSFRIGWLEGSARLVRERITDTSLAEAVQRNPFARDAESLLLCHAGRIELRVSAGSTAPKDAAIVYAQVLAALLRVSEPLGVLTLGNIHPAELLIDHSEFIRRGDFPVLSVIYLGMAEDLGEHYISSYGLRSLGLPEIEIDADGFDPSAAGMLAFSIVERMIAGELTDEAAMLRFGPDPEHLTQLAITKRPGRRVATEVLRLTQGEAPEETPQA